MINVKKRQRKRKTTTLRTGSLFPVYNEALAFDVADANLEDIRLQVFVKQELESSPDQVVGRVVLGTNAEGLELQHWKEAMTSKKPIAQWHSLREYHPADQAITGVVSPTHKSVISKKNLPGSSLHHQRMRDENFSLKKIYTSLLYFLGMSLMCPSLSVSQATAKCKDEDVDDYGTVTRTLVPRSQCCSYSADA